MTSESSSDREVVESEIIEPISADEGKKKSSGALKKVGMTVLAIAFVLLLVLALLPKPTSAQANKIAEDNGYELIDDDAVRSDGVAQSMLVDRLYPDAVKGDNELPSERAEHTIFDVGSKDGESYLLRIDLDNEKVTKVKDMSKEDQYQYNIVSDTSKSFH